MRPRTPVETIDRYYGYVLAVIILVCVGYWGTHVVAYLTG